MSDDNKRPPAQDSEPLPTPSQGGRSGGELARDVGTRDSLERVKDKDKGVTRVRRQDELNHGEDEY